jgi:hypothetical protein
MTPSPVDPILKTQAAVATTATHSPLTAGVSTRQLSALLGALGLAPADHSPLAIVQSGEPRITPTDRDVLVGMGWMDAGGQMTTTATAALQAVAQPTVCIEMVLGTPDTLLSTAAYVGRPAQADAILGPESLVFLNVDDSTGEARYRFQPGCSPVTIADSLRDQLMLGPLEPPASTRADLSPGAFVALLGMLDWRLHSLLSARLDREADPAVIVTPASIWEMIVEGRTARDLTWAVTLYSMLMPFLPLTPDQADITVGLAELATARLAVVHPDGRHALSRDVRALADALYPILSFGCVHVTRWGRSGGVSERVLTLLRGRAAILMVQPGTNHDGKSAIGVDMIGDVELAEILFRMAQNPDILLPPEPVPPDVARSSETIVKCPACGRTINRGVKFCRHCGTPLT